MTARDLNEEFRQVFEAIKVEVNRIAALETSVEFELNAAVNSSYRVRNRRAELHHIRSVRNAQAHPQQNTRHPAFVVTESFVDFCRDVQRQIAQANPSGKMGIALSDLSTATWESGVHDVIRTMRSEKYSHIPILDDGRQVVGVFNESAVFDYLMASGMMSILEKDTTLSGLREHCRIGADHIETFRFIGPRASEDEVIDVFVSVEGPFTRVGAVFVTASGKADEAVQRMITAWDVLSEKTRV